MPPEICVFQKLPKTADDLIALLEKRNLIIADKDSTRHYLEHIGYYRLSAYMKPLQEPDNPDHPFIEGTTFEQLIYFYDFDRSLRLLTMNALEKIEVSFKSVISNTLSLKEGATWYSSPENFRDAGSHKKVLREILEVIEFGLPAGQIKNQSIEHYYRKYDYPFYPPSWMVFETLSFGTISILFMNLKESHKNEISYNYGFHAPVIQSWLQSLSYTRNLCAHHARLWNRIFTIKPKQPAKKLIGELGTNERFYAQAVMMQALMLKISPKTKWAKRLSDLLDQYDKIDPAQMGFAPDWKQKDIWSV